MKTALVSGGRFKSLTPATQKFLSPLELAPTDRIRIRMNEDATQYICDIYADLPPERAVERITHGTQGPWLQDGRFYSDTAVMPARKGYATYHARNTFPTRVPERKKLQPEQGQKDPWQFAATDVTSLVIASFWSEDQIVFADEEAKIVFQYNLALITAGDRNVDLIARFKSGQFIPEIDSLEVHWLMNGDGQIHPELHTVANGAIELRSDKPLARYQQIPVVCALRSEGFGFLNEQGTGKTPQGIAVICNEAPEVHRKERRMYRALVVCPKNVRMNWVDEFDNFTTCPGRVTVLRGGQIKRIKQLIEAIQRDPDDKLDYTAVVVSQETMTRMVDTLKPIEWDLIILDEAHGIKAPQTKRTKAALNLRDYAKKRLILTGTPIANTPLDIYSQFEFMGKGYSGFMSWKEFKNFYGVFDRGEDGRGEKLVAIQNMPFMKERMSRFSFVVKKNEVLKDLPEKLYDVVEVEMTDRQRECYDQLRKTLVLEIENELNSSENKQLVINSALTKLLRLAQITSGFISWDATVSDDGEIISPRAIEYFTPNAKLDALEEILAEKGPNDKTIIWAHWRPDIMAISERLKKLNIRHCLFYGGTNEADREAARYAFNYDPETKIIVGSAGAGGTGLNLIGYPPGDTSYKTNCNHAIYYSQDWSFLKRDQSEARNHRKGTRENVRVTDLCVPGTIDEEIRARVVKKKITAWEISDLRDVLSSVLRSSLEVD